MKTLAVFGINHKRAKSDIRGKIALNTSLLAEALNIPRRMFDEVILLSTCNRMEIYVADQDNLKGRLKSYVKGLFNIEEEHISRFYFFSQKEALSHLIKVASSLDSMIVGETEILGQLKAAYNLALEKKAAKKTLSRIFQYAFRVAKRIRTETNIAKGNYSIPSIACCVASERLQGLKDKTAMVIGGGKISCITIKNLIEKGTKTIFIANRTFKKTEELAKRFGLIGLNFNDCFERFNICDLIISQTSSPHYIIRKDDIPPLRKRPLVLIDLAIPRDIEETIKEMEDVFLYDIDSFQEISNKTLKEREGEIKKALLIIEEEVNNPLVDFLNHKS